MTSPDKSGITVGTRSYTTHWDTILLELFTPQECENYLRNSGYGSV
jgi:hypothetical protein